MSGVESTVKHNSSASWFMFTSHTCHKQFYVTKFATAFFQKTKPEACCADLAYQIGAGSGEEGCIVFSFFFFFFSYVFQSTYYRMGRNV